jgi:hypothetical protein
MEVIMPITNIRSEWVSGNLVFYEEAVGRSTTGDVFTLGTTAVTVGNSAQDVDFKVFLGAADQYVLFDCGNAKVTFAKVDVEIDGDLTLDLEDLQLGDNQYLQFGDATGGDVYMSWVSATSLLQVLPATDDTGAINIGNGTKDIDFKVFLGSASNYVDFNVGDTQMALVGVDITTDAPVVITNATATSSTSTGALIVTGGIATAADITCGDDLFMPSAGVINFNAGNVTITHSAGALACTGALTISTGTESTSTTTGTLIVTGGIGFSGDMYVGDDIFFASGAVINFDAGDVTLTHSSNTLTLAGGDFVFGTGGGKIVDAAASLSIYGGNTSGDKLYLYGTSTTGANYGSVQVGNFADSYANPLGAGAIGLGNETNTGIRAFVVAATDGGIAPTKRIESSCHAFVQRLDWSTTTLSATAHEGVFYGGFDLVSTSDNINISGAGGWIYLTDESGVTGAGTTPVIGTDAAKKTYVAGLESWVALPASYEIKACGYVCGLKLSNNFVAPGTNTGAGFTYCIYAETVDTVGYDYFFGTNHVGNGIVLSANAMTTNATAWAMKVDINGTAGYIPVFDTVNWS